MSDTLERVARAIYETQFDAIWADEHANGIVRAQYLQMAKAAIDEHLKALAENARGAMGDEICREFLCPECCEDGECESTCKRKIPGARLFAESLFAALTAAAKG